jgi:hypothetical protein
MGQVWRGRDQVLDREVAVKGVLVPPALPAEERALLLARTRREGQATARLEHPSVITIHDVVEQDGVPWIVMRFVSGPSLAAEVKRNGRLPWRQVAEIGEQIVDALAHAHAAGIVHRDLKPDNILLSGRRAIVTDFGIAHVADATTQLTDIGTLMGTPNFMAPEQFDGRPVGPSTDMWALGATLYAATEGRPPFEGPTVFALMAAVVTKAPAPPQHAGPLTGLIQSLLAKDAARRPGAAAIARSLSLLLSAPAVEAPAAAQPQDGFLGTATIRRGHASRPVAPRRRKARAAVVAAVTGAAIVTAVVALFLLYSPSGYFAATQGHHPGTAAITGPITGSLSATLKDPAHEAYAEALNGTTLAVGSTSTGTNCACGTYLWNVATQAITATLTDPRTEGVNSVAFSPSGSTLATGDGNGSTYIWNRATRTIIATLTDPTGEGVTSVAFGPGGTTLATADSNGSTYIWDIATRSITATLTDPATGSVTSVAFGPGGTLAAGDFNGGTYLWDIATKTIASTLTDPKSGGVSSVAFGPAGTTLAAGDFSGKTYLWDIATRTITATLTDPKSNGSMSVAFGSDGKSLAAGDGNGSTYLWNLATGNITATLATPKGQGVSSVAFGPGDTLLATGNRSGSTSLWRIATYKP